MRAGIAAGAMLVAAAGCTLPDFFHPKQPTPVVPPTPQGMVSNDFTVSALVAYRLAISPALADLPSRLLVVQLRLSGSQVGVLSLTGDDVQLVLPNGEPGRVFDRGRALELLRRTTLADGDLSYVQRGGPPGGLDDAARLQMTEMIQSNLLIEGVFTADQPIQGFVVVDTGTALSSLDGVSFDVIAYRLRDSAAAHGAYRFAAAPPSTGAP